MTSFSMLGHIHAVEFAIMGVGTPYSGPFRGSKAAAQIALGASGTTGAQVAHTMLLARLRTEGGLCARKEGWFARTEQGGGPVRHAQSLYD